MSGISPLGSTAHSEAKIGSGKKLRFGFVGVKRGCRFIKTILNHPNTSVASFCDIDEECVKKLAKEYNAEGYVDYEEMLNKSRPDVVVIGTPMQYHASQSIAAIKRDIHVLCEVTAAISIDECKQLVAASKNSKAIYMMAENYPYTKPNVQIGEMVKAGVFGEIFYLEGEYLHELKQMNEDTPWRRKWQTGVNGCTYGTHSLGTILQWLGDQRVVAVSCVGTGHHYKDPRENEYELEETIIMLCRLSGGALAKIRLDMLSNRPHATSNYALQGVDGAYESARHADGTNRIWARGLSSDPETWDRLEDYEDRFLPDFWKNPPQQALEAGHGGGDYFEIIDFLKAIRGEAPCQIDIHRTMDMTLPGLISQQSIVQNGIWIDVPDSRTW